MQVQTLSSGLELLAQGADLWKPMKHADHTNAKRDSPALPIFEAFHFNNANLVAVQHLQDLRGE